MNWTNEKPTKHGWYWCAPEDMSRGATPCMIIDGGRGLYFGGWGDNRAKPLSEVTGLQFAGPIPEPGQDAIAELRAQAEAERAKESHEDRLYWNGFIDGLERRMPKDE